MNTGAPTTSVVNQPTSTSVEVQKEISRGMGAAQAGDKAAAYRIFQMLAKQHTDAPDVWVWLGGTSPNLDEAEAAFQRAVMLDPNNEEANLGLRWVTLRKQTLQSSGMGTPNVATGSNIASGTSPLDTGVFTMGRNGSDRLTDNFQTSTSGLSAAASNATGPLGTGFLSSGSLNTSMINNGTGTGPLRASDVDKSVKMKVGGRSGFSRVPIGAIILIIIALALYAFAAWMLLK